MKIHVEFDNLSEITEFCLRMLPSAPTTHTASVVSPAPETAPAPAPKPAAKPATRAKKAEPAAVEPPMEPATVEPPAEQAAAGTEWTLEAIRALVQTKMKTIADGTTKLKEALQRCGAESISQNNALDPASYAKFAALVEEIK